MAIFCAAPGRAQTPQGAQAPSRHHTRTASPEVVKGPLPLFPMQPLWTLALNNPLTAPPAYDATRGYFAIDGGRLVAYDLVTGTQLWIADAATDSTPAAGEDLVFVAEPDRIVALHARDGSPAWALPFAERLVVPLVWDTGWLIAATTDGAVIALRASDGHRLWRRELGSPAHAQPALAGDRVYVPVEDGRVVALTLQDGAPEWEYRLGGPPGDILALVDRLYVGSRDNFFYCLSTKDGTPFWRWRTGGDIIGMPALDERSLYFVSLDNVVRAVNPHSGVQRWFVALSFRPTGGAVRAADQVFVPGPVTSLRGYAALDGKPGGELPAGGEIAAPPHVLARTDTEGPIVFIVVRDIAKGASVIAAVHSLEPAIVPVSPLPNPVTVTPRAAPPTDRQMP